MPIREEDRWSMINSMDIKAAESLLSSLERTALYDETASKLVVLFRLENRVALFRALNSLRLVFEFGRESVDSFWKDYTDFMMSELEQIE